MYNYYHPSISYTFYANDKEKHGLGNRWESRWSKAFIFSDKKRKFGLRSLFRQYMMKHKSKICFRFFVYNRKEGGLENLWWSESNKILLFPICVHKAMYDESHQQRFFFNFCLQKIRKIGGIKKFSLWWRRWLRYNIYIYF